MVLCENCRKKVEQEEEMSAEEKFFLQWSDTKFCLAAVKEDGYSLRYVKAQSEAVCLAAVKENGDSLQYVKAQSEAVCLAAVKKDGDSLRYVKARTIWEKCVVVIQND